MPHLLAYDPRLWTSIGFEILHAMFDPFGFLSREAPASSAPSPFDDGED
ncbi:MAG TPA: hypothetical protein VFY28_00530 [Candidatus Paceibacterota bacterium]|nr:hypothetical protein [Candidatus Paceibacterota bacterium]